MIENYEVNITRYAYGQMNDIRRYIEEEFHSAESAKKLLLAMKDSIGGGTAYAIKVSACGGRTLEN